MSSGGEAEERDLAALLEQIEKRGLMVSSYKGPCLKRRLAVRMRATGVHSYGAYAEVLRTTPQEFDLLLDALTINVTKFFRNPESYAVIKERVIPALAKEPQVAVWSAGCATGEEPYSLAILFLEAGLKHRVRIDATDLDPTALSIVAKGEYPATAVDGTEPELLRRWFSAGPPYRLKPEVMKLVTTRRHDLVQEPPPAPPYHLIACRNVVIYFDRTAQESLFQRFHDALVPGGYLLLGKVETLFGPARQLFRVVDARERLFQRPA